jgi:hypothetical protein
MRWNHSNIVSTIIHPVARRAEASEPSASNSKRHLHLTVFPSTMMDKEILRPSIVPSLQYPAGLLRGACDVEMHRLRSSSCPRVETVMVW